MTVSTWTTYQPLLVNVVCERPLGTLTIYLIFFPFLSGLMTKMGFVLRHWFWSFEDNSEGVNSKYLGPWFLSRWLDVMIKVHTLIEFLAYKTILQPLYYWSAHQIVKVTFSTGKLRKRFLFWTNRQFVFFFNCPNWEKLLKKNGAKKLEKTFGEPIIKVFLYLDVRNWLFLLDAIKILYNCNILKGWK